MSASEFGGEQVLEGKVAIITGAGSGIGKATTSLFLQEGATVVAADLNYDSVAALQDEFPEYKDRIKPFKVNVGNSDEVEAMVDYCISECGKMDIIFNNAGIMDNMLPIDELDNNTWDRVMKINVGGVMFACRRAVQYFLKRGEGGVILNTASVGGLYGGRAGLAYTASKHAVVGITKNIAFMYGDVGIRCNAICPGGINTNIGASITMPSNRGMMRTQAGTPLMSRLGDPMEIATAAVYLSCDRASFINGTTLTVDGGWCAF